MSIFRSPSAHRPIFALLVLALLLALSGHAAAQATVSEGSPADPLTLGLDLYRLESGQTPAGTGPASVLAVITLRFEGSWHAYAHDPGSELGQPTRVVARLNGRQLATLYPRGAEAPDPFEPDRTVRVYESGTPVFVPLTGFSGGDLELHAAVSLLLCSAQSCMPVREEVPLQVAGVTPENLEAAAAQPFWETFRAALPEGAAAPEPSPAPAPAPEAGETKGSPYAVGIVPADAPPTTTFDFTPVFFRPGFEIGELWKAFAFALLAGLILNLMPCVLPVASLKLKGVLTGFAEADPAVRRARFRNYNLFFALGILTYFIFLGVALSAFHLAWGQLFQKPSVVMGLAAVVFALSLSLFGVFDLPVIDLKNPADGAGHTPANAFFTGVLATILATPCSGPFLGGVLAWALLQPHIVVASVFFAIGVGMALPYLLMAARPALLSPFGRPGPWVAHVERVAAFFLAGTAIYLLNILPETLVRRALVLFLLIGFAAWMWGCLTTLSDPPGKRFAIRAAAALMAVSAFFWSLHPSAPEARWQRFDPATFAADLGKKPMLLDFTADWCPNCKFLEMTVLTDENLKAWGEKYGLTFVKVDLTAPDELKQRLLLSLGSRSIPVVAIFPADGSGKSPLVLRDLFTAATLEEALDEYLKQ